jgi:hypothetical protein
LDTIKAMPLDSTFLVLLRPSSPPVLAMAAPAPDMPPKVFLAMSDV